MTDAVELAGRAIPCASGLSVCQDAYGLDSHHAPRPGRPSAPARYV